jgi:hypothetical protein
VLVLVIVIVIVIDFVAQIVLEPPVETPCMSVQSYFDHEKRDVYMVALEFVGWAGELLDGPLGACKISAVKLSDRARTSLPLNIAEGNGKRSNTERCRYLGQKWALIRGRQRQRARNRARARKRGATQGDPFEKGKVLPSFEPRRKVGLAHNPIV